MEKETVRPKGPVIKQHGEVSQGDTYGRQSLDKKDRGGRETTGEGATGRSVKALQLGIAEK